MIILFNGFYCFCMFVSKHFVKRVRPKKVLLFPEISRVKFFYHLDARIVECVFLNSKKKKKMTKRQNKLRRKREYLWKTGAFVILQQHEVRTFKNKNKRKSLRHIFLSFSLSH